MESRSTITRENCSGGLRPQHSGWAVALVILTGLLVSTMAVAEQPLSKDDVTLLLIGGASTEKIVQLVNQRGIDFQMSPDLAKKFQDTGASPELIQALQKAGQRAATPPPAVPPSTSTAAPPAAAPSPPPVAAQVSSQEANEPGTEQKIQEVLQGLSSAPAQPTATNAPIAPPIRLKEIFGQKITPADYQGKVLLLNFWATWCPPCRSEIPAFVELQERYRSQGFQIIGIAMDDGAGAVRSFYKQYRINYPVAMGDKTLASIYGGMSGLPTSFLIGRDGRIYRRVKGELDPDFLESQIKRLLAAPVGQQVAQASPGGGSSSAGTSTSATAGADGVAAPAVARNSPQEASPQVGTSEVAQSGGAAPVIKQVSAPATKPTGGVDLADPSPDKIQQIIQEFAHKETLFKEARNNYTYHQINKVQELGPDGEVAGVYEQEWDILFDDSGKRIERVTYAPADTLKRIMVTQEDINSMRNINPFVLTSDELPEYEIKYLGHVKLDEITAYVFSLRPKEIKKGQQYFQGVVWVDDRDLQIVKSEGKPVPELKTKKGENLFPRFTTWREQIDGKFWFPTYTMADDTLYFSTGPGPVHIKQVIRYSNYKQFKATSKVGSVTEIQSPKPDSAPKNSPPKPQ
jgi:thiol-disulfide isomerase/thioredoxin